MKTALRFFLLRPVIGVTDFAAFVRLSCWLFRHRIMSVTAPGMTSAYSLYSHPQSLKGPPFINCINHVVRTSGGVATIRPDHRRNGRLVKFDGQYEYFF